MLHTMTNPLNDGSLKKMTSSCSSTIPSGKLTWQWKMGLFEDIFPIYWKWGFSIAMLVYWSVSSFFYEAAESWRKNTVGIFLVTFVAPFFFTGMISCNLGSLIVREHNRFCSQQIRIMYKTSVIFSNPTFKPFIQTSRPHTKKNIPPSTRLPTCITLGTFKASKVANLKASKLLDSPRYICAGGPFDDLEMVRERNPAKKTCWGWSCFSFIPLFTRVSQKSQVGFLAGFLVAICPVAWRWAWRCEQERFFIWKNWKVTREPGSKLVVLGMAIQPLILGWWPSPIIWK